MLTFHSFLQRICLFVNRGVVNIAKRLRRQAAVCMAGTFVVSVVAFTSAGFGGGGKNALAAPADQMPEQILIEDPEEEEPVTEAEIRIKLTGSTKQSQILVGDLLVKDLRKQQEKEEAAKAEVEKIKAQIIKEAEERALEEARKAEEARIAEETRIAEKRRKEEAARKAASSVSYTQEDYQVLLRIVQAEAGICDDKGKILVANVILNRVKSKEFPGSIRRVVYEPSQFSPVSNGSINQVQVTKQTINCVDRALAGEDYSQGALYFMNRGGSRSRAVGWFDSHLTYLFKHGNHEFFK